ncbi:hypothetical protein P8C59_009514 [Phyllachora maydis]|uniref:Uncharacterized protein n=1 Tax=Phyllachora maydis TaxID=1825666 RepID=A0AAD9IE36_9PEZI|nr:hypothetical protein P8C59_009514 [Phyllachora maydis]
MFRHSRDYVSLFESLPLVKMAGRPKKREAARNNQRYQIDDAAFANRLWLDTGLQAALLDEEMAQLWGGELVGLNEKIPPSRGRSVLSGGPYDPDPDPLLGLLAPTAPPPALAGVVFVFGGTLAGGARGGGAGPMGRGAS